MQRKAESIRRALSLLLALGTSGHALSAETPEWREVTTQRASEQAVYYPGPHGDWERRRAEDVGLDSAALAAAVAFATSHESQTPHDMEVSIYADIAGEPHNEIVGPTRPRVGGVNGVLVRNGYVVAEWGDLNRVDMTFSATKSYLSTMVGIAVDGGLIRDVHDPVGDYVHDGSFDSDHNSRITWHHLLNQTSDWSGVLWDKPDWADRPLGDKWDHHRREMREPGTYFKYNDVRVNLLALAALHVWRRPLPQVLKEHVMDPIGASTTWRWHGYRNSWVTIDGLEMQSVAGGGHWGGGMWIHSLDHARFGLLCLRRGLWRGHRVFSEEWLQRVTTPGSANVTYGYMNFMLNTDRERLPSAPETSYFHAGGVGDAVHAIWVDPEHELVIVVRWLQNRVLDDFISLVLDAIVE